MLFVKFIRLKFLGEQAFRREHALGYKVAHREIIQRGMVALVVHVVDESLDTLFAGIAKRYISAPGFYRTT